MVYFLIKSGQKKGHDEKRLGTTAIEYSRVYYIVMLRRQQHKI